MFGSFGNGSALDELARHSRFRWSQAKHGGDSLRIRWFGRVGSVRKTTGPASSDKGDAAEGISGQTSSVSGRPQRARAALEMRQQQRDGLPLFGGKWTPFFLTVQSS
jgi:hypothetical protein